MSLNIVGISAFFHNSACCLIQDGILTAAAEEERFSRIKADPSAPRSAFRYCLNAAGLTLSDIECIVYYEDPRKKLARQLWSGLLGHSPDLLRRRDPDRVENDLREQLGYEGPIMYTDHHEAHAASSFFFSGFEHSALFTVDGVGEWATTTYGTGGGTGIDIFEEVHFPDSLGLLYSTITSYLGFGVNDGEYKVMGLAPYGKSIYANKIRELIQMEGDGKFRLDMQYFSFLKGTSMYSEKMVSLLGVPARKGGAPLEQEHADIAKSIQVVLEETLVEKAKYLYRRTGSDNLCMAGGVALNCVANSRILKETPFKHLFVQPAAGDAGGCLGAAALGHIQLTGTWSAKRLSHVYLGAAYSSDDILGLLNSLSLTFEDCRGAEDTLLSLTAKRLADGKVIGWFQGRMEFGPRSLGARSILADPRNPEMRDRINSMVKKREGFRPFAPAIIESKATEYFDIDHQSPFMLETCKVISSVDLPAITHVDGSARLQTVNEETNRRFYKLLMAFADNTGCPILLNTSFNVKGEPIVCSPEDGLKCFVLSDIDCLVIEDFIVDKSGNNFEFLRPIMAYYGDKPDGIIREIYTFI